MNSRILIVDDERNVRLNYRVALQTEGFDVTEASDASEALEQLRITHFEAAILDLRMPGMDGLELLRQIRERQFMIPVAIITAYGDVPQSVEAMKLGAIDFLSKPVKPEELRSLVSRMAARHAPAESERVPLPDTFDAHFQEAQRLINLRRFGESWQHLSRALELHANSPEALNLAGVMFEMKEDYERARKLYGKAIKYSPSFGPAQQNMRRIFELFHFGSSAEPYALGE